MRKKVLSDHKDIMQSLDLKYMTMINDLLQQKAVITTKLTELFAEQMAHILSKERQMTQTQTNCNDQLIVIEDEESKQEAETTNEIEDESNEESNVSIPTSSPKRTRKR